MESFSEMWYRCADNPLYFVALIVYSSITIGGLFCVGWHVFDVFWDMLISFLSRCIKRLIACGKKP